MSGSGIGAQPASWLLVSPLEGLTQISVAPGGLYVWGVQGDAEGDNVYLYAAPGPQWSLVKGVHLTSISAAADGAVWGVDGTATSKNNIHLGSGGQWSQPYDGILTCIAVGLDGAVWGINASQPAGEENIYSFDAQANQWQGISGSLSSLVAGPDGIVWGLTSDSVDNVVRYTPNGQQLWTKLSSGAQTTMVQLAVSADRVVWGVDASQGLWFMTDEADGLQPLSGSGTWISASDAQDVWVLGTDGVYAASIDLGDAAVVSAPVEKAVSPSPRCEHEGLWYEVGDEVCMPNIATWPTFYRCTAHGSKRIWTNTGQRC